MRSVLAGLRRLVVPWGARPTDEAIIIDGDPPSLFTDADISAVLIFQYSVDGVTRRAFFQAVEIGGPTAGVLRIANTDFSDPLNPEQYMDLVRFTDGSGSVDFAFDTGGHFGTAWGPTGKLTAATLPPIKVYSTGPTARAVDSVAASGFVDFVGSPSFTYNKAHDLSNLTLIFRSSWFASVANTGVRFALNVAGTDFPICKLAATVPAGSHLAVFGSRDTSGTSIAAGAITIKPRWERPASGGGAGTCQADAQDEWSCTVIESLTGFP